MKSDRAGPRGDSAALFAAAQQQHGEGRLEAAERFYAQLLALDPGHVQGLHWRGVLAAQRGRSRLAVVLIGKAIALRSDIPELHNSIANALVDMGRVDDAIGHYLRATALNPDYAEAHFNLANLLQARHDAPAAIAHYRRALEVRPDDLDVRMNLGAALAEQGEFRAAVAELEKVLVLRPGFAAAHLNLGHALAELGLLDEAAAHYRRAAAAQPHSAAAFANLGIALRQQGRIDEAVAAFRQALAAAPDHVRARVDLGLALADQGKHGEAMAEADAVLRHDDGAASFPHYPLGVLLARCNRREEAAMQFQRSIAQDPADRRGARLCLAALGLAPAPERAPDELLAALYQVRAGWWDRAQQTSDPYPGAREVAATVLRLAHDPASLDVLDAGCGAGLIGMLIGPQVRRIDGIDLSGPLLSRARDTAVYRELHHGDLVAFLAGHPESCDIITAAAVLVHFGDLRPVFAAAATCLRDGGLFVFTLFCNEADDDAMAVGSFAHGLVQTGSFVHGRGYVRRTAGAEGFSVECLDRAIHDYHDGAPRMGLVVALRRGAAGAGAPALH